MTVIRRVIFIGLFIVLVLSGCQRGDQQDIAFLEDLGEDIASLFNSKKNDLHMDLSLERIDEVGEKVTEGQAIDFSQKNQKRMNVLEEDFVDAREMFTLEEDIAGFFVDDLILNKAIDFLDIEKAEDTFESFNLKKYEKYDERVGAILVEARAQANQIILVEDLFADLFDEEGLVREDSEVDREQLVLEIKKIKNEEVRADFEEKLESLDENEEPEESEEEEEETEMDSEDDSASDSEDEGNFSSSENSNTGSTSGNSSGWNSGSGSSNTGGSQGSGGSSNSGGSGNTGGSGGSGNPSSGNGSGGSSEKEEPEDEKPENKPEEKPEEEVEKPEKPEKPESGGNEEDDSSSSSENSGESEE